MAWTRVFVAKPQAIASSELALDLDPSIFPNITTVTARSAAERVCSFATVIGMHADVQFGSPFKALPKKIKAPRWVTRGLHSEG